MKIGAAVMLLCSGNVSGYNPMPSGGKFVAYRNNDYIFSIPQSLNRLLNIPAFAKRELRRI